MIPKPKKGPSTPPVRAKNWQRPGQGIVRVGAVHGLPGGSSAQQSVPQSLNCWTSRAFGVMRAVLLSMSKALRACWLRKTSEYQTLIDARTYSREWNRL